MATQQYRVFGQSKWMGVSGNALLSFINKTGSGKKISIHAVEISNNTTFGYTQTADTNLPSPTRIKICRATAVSGGTSLTPAKLDSDASAFPSSVEVKYGSAYTLTLVQTHPNSGTYTDASVAIGDTVFTPGSAPSPAWVANQIRDAESYFVVASGGNAGTYRVYANGTADLTVSTPFISATSTSGYVAIAQEICHHGILKMLLPSASAVPLSNMGNLHGKNTQTGSCFSVGFNTDQQSITIRANESIVVVATQANANIPMFVEATLVVDGSPDRTYQVSYYTYIDTPESAILSINNTVGSGQVVFLTNLSISEVGTMDTPYFQLVPVGAFNPDLFNDSDKKLTVVKMDSDDIDLSTSVAEVFTNAPILPFGVPSSYLSEGSAGSPKGFNYLNTKDFLGPVYMTYFPEASIYKPPITAFWSQQVPGTLGSQTSHCLSTIKGMDAPIVIREGEGFAIVSGAETATGTTAVAISGWGAYDFAITFIVENATTPELEFTGLIDNTEVRIYEAGTTTLLGGVENSSGGTFSYVYDYSPGEYVDIMLVSLGYEIIRLENVELTANGSSIPIQQRVDRNYSNS